MFDREAYLNALYYDLAQAQAQTVAQSDGYRRSCGLAIERRIWMEIVRIRHRRV